MAYIDFRKIKNGPPCPICGSDTVRRQSEYGEFWGCVRYPNCTGLISDEPRDYEPCGIDDLYFDFGMPQEWFD